MKELKAYQLRYPTPFSIDYGSNDEKFPDFGMMAPLVEVYDTSKKFSKKRLFNDLKIECFTVCSNVYFHISIRNFGTARHN
jgi:hypothetical protein